MRSSLPKRVVAESLGTAFLVAAVVGSGIMAERLSGGNLALTLLANTIATGAALVASILALGSISGAHFNPVVSLADAIAGRLAWGQTPIYMAAQVLGGVAGAILAHGMFTLPLVSFSLHARSGPAQRGQARRSSRSKDGIHERRQRLDAGRDGEHDPRDAEEHQERHHPLAPRLVAPEAARAVGDGGRGAAEHEEGARDLVSAADQAKNHGGRR